MTGSEIAQIILATATLIAAIGTFAVGWHNANKLTEVKANTDGLTDKLVAATAKSSKAEGKLEGKAEAKAGKAK